MLNPFSYRVSLKNKLLRFIRKAKRYLNWKLFVYSSHLKSQITKNLQALWFSQNYLTEKNSGSKILQIFFYRFFFFDLFKTVYVVSLLRLYLRNASKWHANIMQRSHSFIKLLKYLARSYNCLFLPLTLKKKHLYDFL